MNADLWEKIKRNAEDVRRSRHNQQEAYVQRMYYLGLLHGLKWNANADDYKDILALCEDMYDVFPMVNKFDQDAYDAEIRIEREMACLKAYWAGL